MEMQDNTVANITTPDGPDLDGLVLPPGVALGKRTERSTHSDTYQVLHHSNVVPFLEARVFDLAPEPAKVRKHRVRCIRRLETRKVLEETVGGSACRGVRE
ncbi:uncharacterized protein PG986_002473 [Apiospora aurea]|uniref:Uncharacterized protein n=1 Tax=Apiospora aurea TaxID=335848 RepID=A0ABR1QPB8_9PEZI